MKTQRLSGSAQSSSFRRKAVALGVAMAVAGAAQANPTGMSVVAGQATAQSIGNLLQITNTPGAILNWQQFNIDAGQTTQFIQQNSASQVFNRVTGGDVSRILGTLQSNGQVFLINPAGVFFGQGAVIDTAGFLASTLAASDTDLLNGHLRFKDEPGTAGGILNQGKLTTHSGGSVVLLAPSIENSGIIHSDGEVLLAAGHSVTIVDLKHPTIGLTVAVKEGEKAVNLGHIVGKNISLFSNLVRNSGVVEATGATLGEGGVIRLVAKGDALVGGRVLAESSGGVGGEIDITGNRVAVLEGTRVSADGAIGGGVVHIGGGWQGSDPTIENSSQTVVQAGAMVSANATRQGHGGEVVVWADGHTRVDSEIQARGGALGGNGGRVETSGKESLSVTVAANTSAPAGQAGQWLIDPANLTIVSQLPAGSVELQKDPEGFFYKTDLIQANPAPTESFLLSSTVVQGLETNGSVLVSTRGTTPGEGNLTVASDILIDSAPPEFTGLNPRLTLEAQGTLNINAAVGLAEGQTTYNGFDLQLNFDLAKPVYIRAPLQLGSSGNLILNPFDTGLPIPAVQQGVLPTSGVNFLPGVNSLDPSQPFEIARIQLGASGRGTPVLTAQEVAVESSRPLQLNVLGADLSVGSIESTLGSTGPQMDMYVGSGRNSQNILTNGSLQYNTLTGKSLTIEAGSSVSTFDRLLPDQLGISTPFTFLESLTVRGTYNLNSGSGNFASASVEGTGQLNFSSGGFNCGLECSSFQVGNLSTSNLSTVSVLGTSLLVEKALLNGSMFISTDQLGNSSFLAMKDVDLNGSITLGTGFNGASFQALGMGATSRLNIGAGSRVLLGLPSPTSFPGDVDPVAKQEGAFISAVGGQFVAEQGAVITLNGSGISNPTQGVPSEEVSQETVDIAGATLDLTGLEGRLDAPVKIVSTGYRNSIDTDSQLNGGDFVVLIDQLSIRSATIEVNAGGAGDALAIGPDSSFRPGFGDFSLNNVSLDFQGKLDINSGLVALGGTTVSTSNGIVNANGTSSAVLFLGEFTSADLYKVNRTNGARLGLSGTWVNYAVTAENAASSAPLSKGNIDVVDELFIVGGLLTDAGTGHSLDLAAEAGLELQDIAVSTTINMAPASALFVRQPRVDLETQGSVTFQDARINMGGNAALIVETDFNGTAILEGTATISSGHQGNLILAGQEVFGGENPVVSPTGMSLTLGSGINLEVTGNQASSHPGLTLYYESLGITTPPVRPVFTVGQLTPEAVAVFEYQSFGPQTTILNGFADPTFVIDGVPDILTMGIPDCSTFNLCVRFDVTQGVDFSGRVTSSLPAAGMGLLESGVSFAAGANLANLGFAIETATEIQFMQGVNVLTAAELVSGKNLLNGSGSTIRLGANAANQTLTNNIQNNGVLELDGLYTLSGLLTGTGQLNNSGTLVLSNSTGSVVQNTITNTGTLVNSGVYSFATPLSGSGLLSNTGTFNLQTSGVFGNAVTNSGTGVLNFNGVEQGLQFAQSFNNAGAVNFGQGVYIFDAGYIQTAGTTTATAGSFLGGNVALGGGLLKGFATVGGNLDVTGGRIGPGASPGLVTVNGDLNLAAGSVLDIEIQGNGGVPGTDFGCIVVQGSANLAGQLNLIDISGGTLGTGNEYSFLKAASISGNFAGTSFVNTGLGYTFTPAELVQAQTGAELITRTVEAANAGGVGTGSTGSGPVSLINQNIDQAFVTPPANTTNTLLSQSSPTTNTPDSGGGSQQEQEAVQIADQSTGGTTVSQQSNEIELTNLRGDAKRPTAVCK